MLHLQPPGGRWRCDDLVKANLAPLDEAHAEAVLVARAHISSAASQGRDISDYFVEICNEARERLSVVTFRAVTSRISWRSNGDRADHFGLRSAVARASHSNIPA
ncbi:DUF6894 family protein [Rhizobium leguminosarum]|uniref:DUF6894 family protein n=1 Tax=Rhizobium leguminosarum TaxID=384 RepID=UPI00391EF963